jgi:hypothetical protein
MTPRPDYRAEARKIVAGWAPLTASEIAQLYILFAPAVERFEALRGPSGADRRLGRAS